MHPNTPKVNLQSSNIFALSTLTAWQIIRLILQQNNRKNSAIIWLVMLTPKWSTCPGRKSPSCFDNILRCHLCNLQLHLHKVGHILWQTFNLKCWSIRKCFAHNLQSNSSPKRFAQSGSMFTSCFSTIGILLDNLQTCFHWMLSQPGLQSIFITLEYPRTSRWINALLTPKWSAWLDKPLTSCLSNISQCHDSNLRSRLHKVTSTFWRTSHLMCWNIRRSSAHNLWSHLHRSGPCNLAKHSPHASKHSQCPSAIFKYAFTKCFHSLVKNQPHTMKHPKTFHRTWNHTSTEVAIWPGW